jgi:hypothetical protein
VQDMWQSGAKTKEIAQYFGLSIRQVQKDLQDAGRIEKAFIQNFDSNSTLGREVLFLENARRKAMRQFQLSNLEAVKLGYLKLAVEIGSKLTTLLQSVGLITTVPTRISFTESNPFEDDEFRKRYTSLLLEARRCGIPISGL